MKIVRISVAYNFHVFNLAFTICFWTSLQEHIFMCKLLLYLLNLRYEPQVLNLFLLRDNTFTISSTYVKKTYFHFIFIFYQHNTQKWHNLRLIYLYLFYVYWMARLWVNRRRFDTPRILKHDVNVLTIYYTI